MPGVLDLRTWVTLRAVARQTGAVGLETLREAGRVLYGGDGALALATAQAAGLNGPLQQVGELVLLALDHDGARAGEFAAKCSGVLQVRGWDGDQELADAIDVARGVVASDAEALRELAVDLEQLADLIDAGPDGAGGRLDLTTGEVWPEFAFEDTFTKDEDDDEDPDRWLHVWPSGSRRAYEDMIDFTATRESGRLSARLEAPWVGAARFVGSRTC